jgi:hypothetical protein
MCEPSTPDIDESSPGRSCLCAFLPRSLVGHPWRQLSQKDLRAAAPAGDRIPCRSKDGDLTTAQIIGERAAAVGVSLSALANEDPTVVAAAVASTGIDPNFLAAL